MRSLIDKTVEVLSQPQQYPCQPKGGVLQWRFPQHQAHPAAVQQ